MNALIGVFGSSQQAAEAFNRLRALGVAPDHVSFLTPGTPPPEIERRTPSEPGEKPGMGAALGSVVGGAVGLTTAALVLPGVGPVVVAGMLAAGIAGAAGGGVVGDRIEENLAHGLPRAELLEYEPRLREGKSLVIVVPDTDDEARASRQVLETYGAKEVEGPGESASGRMRA
jgi:outer membrane lipoprotein SlyB